MARTVESIMSQKEIILNEEINDVTVSAYKTDDAQELIVLIEGSIDSYNAQEFEAALKKLLEAGHANIIFGCAKLNYISSMGIGVFMNFLTAVKRKNGSILFAEVQAPVKKVFDNLGFSMFFTFKDKIEA
jgi:anti-anti-sigma factor